MLAVSSMNGKYIHNLCMLEGKVSREPIYCSGLCEAAFFLSLRILPLCHVSGFKRDKKDLKRDSIAWTNLMKGCTYFWVLCVCERVRDIQSMVLGVCLRWIEQSSVWGVR